MDLPVAVGEARAAGTRGWASADGSAPRDRVARTRDASGDAAMQCACAYRRRQIGDAHPGRTRTRGLAQARERRELRSWQLATSADPLCLAYPQPIVVDDDPSTSVVAIEAGGDHTCALLDDGRVRCWGAASEGQLGYGNDDKIGDDEPPDDAGDVDFGP